MDGEGQIVREILRQNEFMLRRHLVLSKTVLDQLKAEGLLTDHSRRKIMNKPKPVASSLRYRGSSASSSSLPQRSLAEYRQSLRPSITAGNDSLSGLGVEHRERSLASILKAREPQPDPSMSRGFINTRDLLSLQSGAPPLYPELGQQVMTNQSNQRSMGHPRGLQDVPSTLYDLNQAFATQEQQNQQAMNILQQEETAIRQLLDQNARDQGQVRRKQAVVTDISDRLKDIHVRANNAYDPSPHPNIGRYRLSQLNQIPWSL